MAKQHGLGNAFWIGGYDLSGDTQQAKMVSPIATFDFTSIQESAFERGLGRRDGQWNITTFFNPAANAAHPVLSTLPTADTIANYAFGTSLGSPAGCMQAKQVNYDPTRDTKGMLTFAVQLLAEQFGVEFGLLQTPGIRTDAAATNGTSWDWGNAFSTPAVPGSGTPVTNTSPLSATVVISGGTLSNVSVNGVTVGSGDGTYTVLSGQNISITYSIAPTWTWTLATAFGAQAYLQLTAFTGTDVTVKLQDSADNSTFADVASGAFTQITSSTPQTQRFALSNTATLRRYVRVSTVTTGGFTSASFAVVVNRNPIAGVVF